MSDDQDGCEWVNVSSGTGLPRVVTNKRPLNGCVCVCVKFKDFSRIFKYFQAPYLFSSTFQGLEVFIRNSSIFKDFSSML